MQQLLKYNVRHAVDDKYINKGEAKEYKTINKPKDGGGAELDNAASAAFISFAMHQAL